MNQQYITLHGTEQVASAARQMQQVADSIQRAANNLDHSLQMNQRWMDDWLQRFQSIVMELAENAQSKSK